MSISLANLDATATFTAVELQNGVQIDSDLDVTQAGLVWGDRINIYHGLSSDAYDRSGEHLSFTDWVPMGDPDANGWRAAWVWMDNETSSAIGYVGMWSGVTTFMPAPSWWNAGSYSFAEGLDQFFENLVLTTADGTPPTRSVSFVFDPVADGAQDVPLGTVDITATPAGNTPPVLADDTYTLTQIADSGAPSGAVGWRVSDLFGANLSDGDGDPLGIAITGITTQGYLYVSTNDGTSWQRVENSGPNATAEDNAVVLRADGQTRIYYQAQPGASGTITDAFTIRAWDGSDGARLAGTGVGADASVVASGAYSTASDTVSITILPNNATPYFFKAPTPLRAQEDAAAPTNGDGSAGSLVTALVAGSIADLDNADPRGIAVTGIAAGTLHWSTDGGTTWQSSAAGSLSDGSALLLSADADTRIAYEAVSGFDGVLPDTLTVRAWDGTGGATEGTLHDTAFTRGGPFSEQAVSLAVEVAPTLSDTAGNDAPYLLGLVPSPELTEQQAQGHGVTVGWAPTLLDPDDDAWSGGTLTVQRTGGGDDADQISLRHQNGIVDVQGTDLRWFDSTTWQTVGTVVGTGTGSDSLGITFSGVADRAVVADVIKALHYSNASDDPAATRTYSLQVTDPGGASLAAPPSFTVTVTPNNDLAVFSGGPSGTVALTEDDAHGGVLLAEGLTFTDPDRTTFADCLLEVWVDMPTGRTRAEMTDTLRLDLDGAAGVTLSGPFEYHDGYNTSVLVDGVRVGELRPNLLAGSDGFVVAFDTPDATADRVAKVMQAVQYAAASHRPESDGTGGPRTLSLSLFEPTGPNDSHPQQSRHEITFTVSNVNDAPVLTETAYAIEALYTAAQAPADGDAAGILIRDFLGNRASDPDTNAVPGMAVTGLGSAGTLYYSLDDGAAWHEAPALSGGDALLLNGDADTRIAFVPASRVQEVSAVTFRAWDAVADGRAEGTVGALTTGGSGFGSATEAGLSIRYTDVTPPAPGGGGGGGGGTPTPPVAPVTPPPLTGGGGGGGGGSTPPVTPQPDTSTEDGVTVTRTTETGPGGRPQQVTEISPAAAGRDDDPDTPNSALADVTLAEGDVDGDGDGVTQPALRAGLPTGMGLRSEGSSTRLNKSDALADLIARIEQKTEDGSQPREEMTGIGQSFLDSIPDDSELIVKTVTPTVAEDSRPAGPLVITGAATPGRQEALVIDVTDLPRGTILRLEDVDFAAIVGEVRVIGGSGSNVVTGDDSAQIIVLGEDDDILHGGGGDDEIGSEGGDDQLFGDTGNDTVFGGEGDDSVSGGRGDDVLRGDEGTDTVIYSGDLDAFRFYLDGDAVVTVDTAGEEGRDTLETIEVGRFDGQRVDLAFTQADPVMLHAVAGIYHGVLDRAADIGGLNYWLEAAAQHGVATVAQAFTGTPEFAETFGADLSDDQFAENVYQHVLGRGSDAEGKAWWLARLAEGLERGDMIVGFSASQEHIGMVTTDDGFWLV